MTNSIQIATKAAQLMLARANELGFTTKSGKPLVIDQLMELLAAKDGYRNAHAHKAALARQEPPALVQEHADEANNDYKLVAGKGVWIQMGQFTVHQYLTEDGVAVEVFPKGTSFEDIGSLAVTTAEAVQGLLAHHGLTSAPQYARLLAWVQSEHKLSFDTASPEKQAALIAEFEAVTKDMAEMCEWMTNNPSIPLDHQVLIGTTESGQVVSTSTRVVFCIALEGDAETGVEWFYDAAIRDANRGRTGAEKEVYFNLAVPVGASKEDITTLVDRSAWDKDYVALS